MDTGVVMIKTTMQEVRAEKASNAWKNVRVEIESAEHIVFSESEDERIYKSETSPSNRSTGARMSALSVVPVRSHTCVFVKNRVDLRREKFSKACKSPRRVEKLQDIARENITRMQQKIIRRRDDAKSLVTQLELERIRKLANAKPTVEDMQMVDDCQIIEDTESMQLNINEDGYVAANTNKNNNAAMDNDMSSMPDMQVSVVTGGSSIVDVDKEIHDMQNAQVSEDIEKISIVDADDAVQCAENTEDKQGMEDVQVSENIEKISTVDADNDVQGVEDSEDNQGMEDMQVSENTENLSIVDANNDVHAVEDSEDNESVEDTEDYENTEKLSIPDGELDRRAFDRRASVRTAAYRYWPDGLRRDYEYLDRRLQFDAEVLLGMAKCGKRRYKRKKNKKLKVYAPKATRRAEHRYLVKECNYAALGKEIIKDALYGSWWRTRGRSTAR